MDANTARMYVDDRPGDGVFRVHRDVYSDPELFALEQKFVFERTWIFLTLESELRRPNDFITSFIGRTPVLVTRDPAGALRGFVNTCRHKSAVVCRSEKGNAKFHVCAYHGWAYDATGRNVDIKDSKTGQYGKGFDANDHNLIPLARLASYKGMVFGSLTPDVPDLDVFLGDIGFFLDLAMEQGPQGMEFVPGRAAYTYRGNWKLQLDNGLDPYHLTSTHVSFMNIQARRRAGSGHQEARQFDWSTRVEIGAGTFTFDHGHTVSFADQTEPQKRAIYPAIDEIRARVGDVRAEWMLRMRQLAVFPGLQIGEGSGLVLRTFRPLAVDKTEMMAWCLAPIGEAPELRARRLRQFEDFFNPAGLATPDDTVVYEECQRGFDASPVSFMEGYSRGIKVLEQGANAIAGTLGIRPAQSLFGPFETFAETAMHAPHREWARLMQAGSDGRKAYE